jgi:predicted metal-dependent hydrolase
VLPLLRYTLDLFESIQAETPVQPDLDAIASIANHAPAPSMSGLAKALPSVTIEFRHPRATREARLGEALVAYEFRRAKRRSIGFSVRPEGLTVRAPQWVPLYQVDAALREKADWILRKLTESRAREAQLQASRIEWREGASLQFLGAPVRLVLDPRHEFGAIGAALIASPQGDCLHLALPSHASAQQIRDAVQAWLMRQARTFFVERLDHFAPLLQVRWHKLTLSSAGTRWGSARVDGSIRLNWRLIHFGHAVIDYVVAHELSHLRVMDHSPRFWETVRSVVPDYAQLRSQLRDDTASPW